MSYRRIVPPLVTVGLVMVALIPFSLLRAQSSTDPWSASQTTYATEFAKELTTSKSPATVLFVGFSRLYTAAHIKGAQFHGTGGKPEGIEEIKKWAGPLPRSTNLVIYCGCCPMDHCPNVRPAFSVLHEMGFTNLRVLILPTSFAVDWAEKGLPYDKGQ